MRFILSAALCCIFFAMPAFAASFHTARPIWPTGREKEMNVNVRFRAAFEWKANEPAPVLRLAASTTYRAYVGLTFVGYGPARGPHGHFRVDEWDLSRVVTPGINILTIEVAGYAANSFGLINAPSFLQAEVVCDGRVLAATGADTGFTALLMSERVQNVQRYSFQRPFSEVYRFVGGKSPRSMWDKPFADPILCEVLPPVPLLPHGVPYPDFRERGVVEDVAEGKLELNQPVKQFFKDRSLTGISKQLMGYPEDQLEVIPSLDLQKIKSIPTRQARAAIDDDKPISLAQNTFHTLDLGTNLTGFICLNVECKEPAKLYVTFDEILSNGDVDQNRLGCVNIIQIDLEAGRYAFESFEPYTLKYIKLMALNGSCEVSHIRLRELTSPDVWQAEFASSDPRLNRLFDAGRETYRQNALDIFMDCPSRERAGWLCDSFFTSRVAMDLSGHTRIERNVFENFLLPESYPSIPQGMLPMCYPSDHYDGVFIPNWAMWFVIELREYYERSHDKAMVDRLKTKVFELIAFLDRYRNSDGLLEKLPSWVFVEWSAANSFVQDVNYPSNALYASVLQSAGRLYGDEKLSDRADAMRETIRKQSFDGKFFIDNAVRKDGKLEITSNHTETCQYYQFFFGVATPQRYPELWSKLADQFGPKRVEKGLFKDVPPSNSFIGNMLRIEILSRNGRSQQILDESIDYLMYMAERTGTLWENVKPEASCNHGFASHIVHTLYRDILGVRRLDAASATLELRFAPVHLDWCEGRIPTPDGLVHVRWTKKGDHLTYRVDTPAGYQITASATDGLVIEAER